MSEPLKLSWQELSDLQQCNGGVLPPGVYMMPDGLMPSGMFLHGDVGGRAIITLSSSQPDVPE